MPLSNYLLSRVGPSLASDRIRMLEEENARLIAAAATESQRMEAFLRSTAHDLRNSLASVLTGSEVLLSIDASSISNPLLQSIHRQANVIAQIVDRLVNVNGQQISPSLSSVCDQVPAIRADVANIVHERMPLRILAIDDRRDVLLPLRVLLKKEGHEIAEAEDGSSGLEKVATFRPEIVLCDINLAGNLSGLEVARKIRLQRDRSSIYLVAISGNARECDLEDSAKAGFDFHIEKPITANALRNVINNRPTFRKAASDNLTTTL